MRTPDPALGGTDLTNALGTHTVQTFYDVVSPTTVATARINQSVFSYPLITLTVDTTSGWSGVKAGMDVYVGSSAGAADIGVYRVRSSDSTHLTIGEMAQGDAGLLIQPLRTGAFADNQYITVIQRRSIYSVLPLIVGDSFFEDYNTAPTGFNQYPPPVTSIKLTTPKITQYNHLWTFVDDGQDYSTIVFLVTADAWPGTSVSSYAWTVPGSWTVTGGSIATNTFTAQVPSQVANYELRCDVTNNHGFVSMRIVEVWVKARSGSHAPMTMSSLARASWNNSGASLSFTLNDDLLSTLPEGSMVVIAQERLFNGVVIQTAVSQFVGWVTRIGQTTEPGLKTATPEFMTIDGLLSIKRGTSQVWAVATSITTWQQTPAALCSLSFAQFWLLSQRLRGVLELFDFIPASLSATGQRLPRIDVKMATPWQQLVSLADGFQKRLIGCDPDGSMWVLQHPSLVSTYPRTSGAVVVRDTHDASIYHDVDWPRELFPKVGVVEGSAFSWDGGSAQPTPLLSIGPGFTPGQGANDQKCENQVVDSQDTLNALTGNYLAFLNPDYPDVTVNYQGMRGSLIKPAQLPLIHIQIPAYLSPSGVAIDRYAIPTSVDESYNADHTVDSSIHYTFETTGVAGVTKPVPISNSATPITPGVIVFPDPAPVVPSSGVGRGTQNMALFCADGVALTGTFQTSDTLGGPLYVGYDWVSLGLDGTFIGWCPRGGSSPAAGWVFSSTKLYYFTITTQTLTELATFAHATVNRSYDAAFPLTGIMLAVVSYVDGVGIDYLYTSDNLNFPETSISGNYATDGAGTSILPGCYVSTKNGKVYTSRFTATTTLLSESSEGRQAASFGVPVSPLSLVTSQWLAQHIHSPWNNNPTESIIFYGVRVGGSTAHDAHRLYRNAVDVSPTNGGFTYGLRERNQIASSVLNRLRMLVVLQADGGNYAGFLSNDGGDSWPTMWANPGTTFRYTALAGDDQGTGWAWGDSDTISQLAISGTSVVADSRNGNLAALSLGLIIEIAGY